MQGERRTIFFLATCDAASLEKKNEVEVTTEKISFKSKKALITVSVGVLQSEGITFVPSLPGKKSAAKQLGFGHVLKINFLFDDVFWKNDELTEGKRLNDLNFLFSEEEIPTWWTQYPKKNAIITGWLGGPKS